MFWSTVTPIGGPKPLTLQSPTRRMTLQLGSEPSPPAHVKHRNHLCKIEWWIDSSDVAPFVLYWHTLRIYGPQVHSGVIWPLRLTVSCLHRMSLPMKKRNSNANMPAILQCPSAKWKLPVPDLALCWQHKRLAARFLRIKSVLHMALALSHRNPLRSLHIDIVNRISLLTTQWMTVDLKH